MAYSTEVLQRARARLAEARQAHEQEDERRIEAIYEANPRLREIDRQLRATAASYLAQHPENALQPRFDVAEVYAPQGMETKKPEFRYWENAF